MRLATVIFSAVLYLMPSVLQADAPKNAVDSADKILVRLGEMKISDQQSWLQRLENRAIRAAKLSMNADDATQQKTKIQNMLHQKTVTWKILREVMGDVNTHEKTAIDQLVRRYRGLIFDKFNKEPDTLNQWRDVWAKVYLAWKLAGQQFEQQDRLIDWLEQAIQSTESGTMPEAPKFEKEQPAHEEKPQAEEKSPATEMPPAEEKTEVPEKPQAEQEPQADAEKKAEPAEKPEAKKELKQEEKPEAAEKALDEEKPQEMEKNQQEEKPATEQKPKEPADADADMSKTTSPKAAQPQLPSPEAAAQLQKPSSSKAAIHLPQDDQKKPQADLPQTDKQPPARLARRQASPLPAMPDDRKPLPSREAHAIAVTAPKLASDAVQQTSAIDLPTETRVAPPTLAPTLPDETPTTANDQASAAPVEIKVDELASRIDGHNLAFQALESELDENGNWTVERLESFTDRLHILTIRSNDLNLFREALSEDARSSLEKLASPKGSISQLAARIVETRRSVFSDKFKGTDAERQNELQRLDELSRRLAAMAEK